VAAGSRSDGDFAATARARATAATSSGSVAAGLTLSTSSGVSVVAASARAAAAPGSLQSPVTVTTLPTPAPACPIIDEIASTASRSTPGRTMIVAVCPFMLPATDDSPSAVIAASAVSIRASRLETACCRFSLSLRSASTWAVKVSPSSPLSGPAPSTTPIASAMNTETSETRW
jgi:hypothetical protein